MLVQEDDSALMAMALNKSLFTAEADEAKRAAEQTGRPVSDVLFERGFLAARTIDSLRAEVARASAIASGANDRTTTTPPHAPTSGKLPVPCRLGDWEILQKLGEGGMGAVYRARQTSLDRDVALKVMSSHVMEEPEFRERFDREARAMAKINDPHAAPGHTFEGAKLKNTVWMSVNVGSAEVFGLLRTVGDRAGEMRVVPSAQRPAPGATQFNDSRKLEVIFNVLPDGWACMVMNAPVRHVPGARDQYRPVLPMTTGRWSDLGLTRAPTEVWAWAHAGNWDSGRGQGQLVAQVADLCH